MKSIIASLFVSLFSLNAFSADFSLTLSNMGETKGGVFFSTEKSVARDSVLSYELIPATPAVREMLAQESLKTRTCQYGVLVEGSILLSTMEYDHENRRDSKEIVRLFVRAVTGCAAAQ